MSSLPIRSTEELQGVGHLIAQSGMFGVTNPAEGFIVAATCHQQGMSLMEFKETYHVIHGTPSMRADAMVARFQSMGGELEIHERSADSCRVTVRYGNTGGAFGLTWVEAQQEPFVYAGKEADIIARLARGEQPPLKPKYATPRSRMQMLWARVVSDAIRTVCPGANKGTYTPEEVSDFPEVERKVESYPVAVDAEVINRAGAGGQFPESICPIGGPEFEGKKWDQLPSEVLQLAMDSRNEAINDDHRDYIAALLGRRGDI